MFVEELKAIRNSRPDLRRFGYVVGTAFGVFGMLLLWRGRPLYPYFFGLAAGLILAAVLRPHALKPIHWIWMCLATVLGWTMTRVILTALFFVAVTPIGVLARALGKRFLNLKIDTSAKSYWVPRSGEVPGRETYERQY
jgi:hypothetical protein